MLSGCSEPKAPDIALPDDIAKVSDNFVQALANGDLPAARKYVAPSALEDFDLEFDSRPSEIRRLKKVKPISVQRKLKAITWPFDNDVTVTYAAEEKDGWTIFEVQFFWLEEEAVEVESWSLDVGAKEPAQIGMLKFMSALTRYGSLAFALLALIFLIFFIWIIRRKPALVIPESRSEKRAIAVTRRDSPADS